MTRHAIIVAWLLGSAFVAILFVSALLRIDAGTMPASDLWRSDFTNVWSAGKLIAQHAYTTLYYPVAFTRYQTEIWGPVSPRIYSYPPTAFPIAGMFSWLPYRPALIVWSIATSILFAFAARAWWPTGAGPIWLAVLMPASVWNLWIGHYGFVFGAIWLLGLRHAGPRPVVAGMLIGLFVLKPQLAVLIPLVLIMQRNWRAVIASAAASTAYLALSLATYGVAAWQAFFAYVAGRQLAFIDPHGAWFGKMSASAATAVFDQGGSWTLAITAQAAFAALGIALVVVAGWKRVDTAALALLAATATFLVLPYSLNYDLTAVSVGALIVMCNRQASRVDHVLATLGFVAPQMGIWLAILGAPVTPLMLAALAVAQFRVAMAGRAVPAGAAAMRSAL